MRPPVLAEVASLAVAGPLPAGDRYSWRDSELFWLICAAQQRQADELAERQADILARLEALERSA